MPDTLGNRVGVVFANVVDGRISILESRTWKDPPQIGMGQLAGEATLATFAARPRALAFTEEQLAKPDGESLLAHSARTMKEHARGKRPSSVGLAESLAQSLVAVEWDDGHDSDHGV